MLEKLGSWLGGSMEVKIVAIIRCLFLIQPIAWIDHYET